MKSFHGKFPLGAFSFKELGLYKGFCRDVRQKKTVFIYAQTAGLLEILIIVIELGLVEKLHSSRILIKSQSKL